MKDPEAFVRELERPIGVAVTQEDLEADGQSFMAFAAAMGIKPPTPAAPAASA